MTKLLIRADAGAAIGAGHVMRCLALAQGWQAAGGSALFVQAQSTPLVQRRLGVEGMAIVQLDAAAGSPADAQETAGRALAARAPWIVVDGYQFNAAWQKQVKDSGARLLAWDDYGHAGHYWADLVLNQNLHADAGLYARREPHTRLLLGTHYVQLRREFLRWGDRRREFSTSSRRVLVTLGGGGDADNATGAVIQAVNSLGGVEAVVVTSGGNPNLPSLQSAVAQLPAPGRLVVDAANMPELMAWADVAVSAGGATCWELAYMGVPNLVLPLSKGEEQVAHCLAEHGACANLGWRDSVCQADVASALRSLLHDPKRREQMSVAGRTLVDGLGSERVLAAMNEVAPCR